MTDEELLQAYSSAGDPSTGIPLPGRRLVLACDGGLAHFGWALLELHGADRPQVVHTGVIRSRVEDGTVTARCAELARALAPIVATRPIAVAHEQLSLPRSAGSAAKAAASLGTLCGVVASLGVPILAVTPIAVRAAMGLTKVDRRQREGAKKQAMVEAVQAECPEVAAIWEASGLPRSVVHHSADAIAVGVAVWRAGRVMG